MSEAASAMLALDDGRLTFPPPAHSSPAAAALWRAYEWVTVENWGAVMLLNQAMFSWAMLVSAAPSDRTRIRSPSFLVLMPSLHRMPSPYPCRGACASPTCLSAKG